MKRFQGKKSLLPFKLQINSEVSLFNVKSVLLPFRPLRISFSNISTGFYFWRDFNISEGKGRRFNSLKAKVAIELKLVN